MQNHMIVVWSHAPLELYKKRGCPLARKLSAKKSIGQTKPQRWLCRRWGSAQMFGSTPSMVTWIEMRRLEDGADGLRQSENRARQRRDAAPPPRARQGGRSRAPGSRWDPELQADDTWRLPHGSYCNGHRQSMLKHAADPAANCKCDPGWGGSRLPAWRASRAVWEGPE